MKIFKYAFVVLNLFFYAADGQVSSSCIPSSLLSYSYSNDIKDLALKRMYEIHSPDTILINIPVIHQDSILAGLAAICNTGTSIQADSVFNAWCIHDFPFGMINQISVKVDTSYAWTDGWKHLSTTTGNGALDSFLTRYGFSVVWFDSTAFSWSLRDRADLVTNMAINVKAFADSLALFPGVIFILDINSAYVGDHNHIFYERDSVSTFSFVLGWGDCPSGCTSSKRWSYKVDDLCNVTMLPIVQHIYDLYPTQPNCNLHPLVNLAPALIPEIRVYPNPGHNVLHLECESSVSDFAFALSDVYGRKCISGLVGQHTTVNISELPSGIYILLLTNGNGYTHYQRVVKE